VLMCTLLDAATIGLRVTNDYYRLSEIMEKRLESARDGAAKDSRVIHVVRFKSSDDTIRSDEVLKVSLLDDSALRGEWIGSFDLPLRNATSLADGATSTAIECNIRNKHNDVIGSIRCALQWTVVVGDSSSSVTVTTKSADASASTSAEIPTKANKDADLDAALELITSE